ncbi:nickel insertion protein [Desulfovibrio litoralis]|uniref:TIGR00299 family protein n=1 Tax=Desulfovibrio litoralis DSM 11393 TaxID=1121455 RepID=A0A1M7S704_9BACT|nr:nickel insertion protein [Desulfovibrio litoralis]SHN54459.1 hypothetical protein SAMN02745728_00540 [Desulfovibrio litoralis DSM 11393]
MHKDSHQKNHHEHNHHNHNHHDCESKKSDNIAITIRAYTGLSGDILLTGLTKLANLGEIELEDLIKKLKIKELENCVKIKEYSLNNISGFKAEISLPNLDHSHNHRHLSEILEMINKSELSDQAKKLATQTFNLLGEAEAKVHGCHIESLAFHEVGALDSILDICLVCALFDYLDPKSFILSPLPLCDGVINCAHGTLGSPAPAVLALLPGVAVKGLNSSGETLTPTALALIKTLGATFGEWSTMKVKSTALVYGNRYFPNVPNGAIFALGNLI